MATLIRGATVVTVDDRRTVHAPGAVLVDGDRIADVGPDAEVAGRAPGADAIIDGAGKIVLPGFVSAHNHLGYAAFRGRAEDVGAAPTPSPISGPDVAPPTAEVAPPAAEVVPPAAALAPPGDAFASDGGFRVGEQHDLVAPLPEPIDEGPLPGTHFHDGRSFLLGRRFCRGLGSACLRSRGRRCCRRLSSRWWASRA